MGLPRPNFARLTERLSNVRVPQRLRSIRVPQRVRALVPASISNRVSFPHGLSAAGGLTLPYKLAVVAVMMLVAGGTLVTFSSAPAQTTPLSGSDTAASGSAMPGTAEATPRVEGQVVPDMYDYTPDTSILSASDLLSSLQLTDYSPTSDDDDDNKSDDDDDNKSDDDDDKKTSSSTKNNNSSSGGSTSGGNSSGGSTSGGSDDGGDSDNGGSTDNGGSSGGSDDGGSDDGGSDNGGSDDGGDDDDDEDEDDDKPIQCNKFPFNLDKNCH